MEKILPVAIIFALSFLLSGCGKKSVVTEKVPEQAAQQENNAITPDNQKVTENAEVPLPQGEDIVRSFFNLIGEGKIPEAVAMMDDSAVPNDSTKQAWGVQFNIISSIAVKSIEPSNIGNATQDQKTYKVVLDVKIKPSSEKAVIPNYGWEDGENIRWVSMKKDGSGIWKILEIGTGP